MAAMDAQQIYDNFHAHAKGTQGLAAAAQTAQELAAKYQDRAVTTQQMINTIQAGWKGTAAEAASQGLAPLAENAMTNHQQLGTGQDIVARQVDSFHTAASQVQPVPAAPSMTDFITTAMNGQNPQPILYQIAHRHAAQQSNVDLYDRYVATSQYNTTNVPTLNSINDASAPVSVVPRTASRASAPRSIGHETARDTLGRYTPAAKPVSRTSSPPAVVGSGASASSGPGNSGTTTTSSAVPVAAPLATPQPAPTGPPTGSSPVHNGPVPMEPIMPVGGAMPPGAGESVPEPGGLRGLPPSEGAPGASGRSDARSGIEPGTAAQEEAMAAERGITARPGTSTAGPVLGGRGGKGTADTEHRRRYGLDVDGEQRFGTEERTAPPVIGETPTEREQRHAQDAGRHHRDQ